jgi:hypothetical protein
MLTMRYPRARFYPRVRGGRGSMRLRLHECGSPHERPPAKAHEDRNDAQAQELAGTRSGALSDSAP